MASCAPGASSVESGARSSRSGAKSLSLTLAVLTEYPHPFFQQGKRMTQMEGKLSSSY